MLKMTQLDDKICDDFYGELWLVRPFVQVWKKTFRVNQE